MPVYVVYSNWIPLQTCILLFKADLIEKIPNRYIHTRWKNDVLTSDLFNIEYRYGVPLYEKSKLRLEFLNLTNLCADRARGDIGVLQDMVDQMKKMKDKIWQDIPNELACNNKSIIIQDLLGVSEPEIISVTAPKGIRTKGSGKCRRKIGPGEKAKKKNKKKHIRECKTCKKLVRDHDSCNCEKVRKARELRRKLRREKGIYEDSSDDNGTTDDDDGSEDEEEEYYSSSSD
ncbi:uncharacterized protein LOC143615710 [Bidens hawaiensis]|uniref:uncharacterized protein LOC143615710 n=1 Tax=Bidens hawaiensis TaxID=980011 RepID=UPI00404AA978